MKCKIRLNDRYGRHYTVRLIFPEAPMPEDQSGTEAATAPTVEASPPPRTSPERAD
jgi:hypothetical protein